MLSNSYKMCRLLLLMLALLIAGFFIVFANQEARPWRLGDLITVSGILVGAVMIIYQLGWQHKYEMELQKENFREKLRLDVYQEFSPVLKAANDKGQRTGMYAMFIPIHLKNYRNYSGQPLAPSLSVL